MISYLTQLGISDIYASPVFRSRKGSMHGYDVTDPGKVNPDLGSAQELDHLFEKVKQYGMGWLQDIVPNHMAYDAENVFLMDVLANGTASPYHGFFDIDWSRPHESMQGRVLAPFLGKFYGAALEDGEIRLAYDKTGLHIRYYDLRFPLKASSYLKVFSRGLGALKKDDRVPHPAADQLFMTLSMIKNTPVEEEKAVKTALRTLWQLYIDHDEIGRFMDACVESCNGKKSIPESFNALDALLSEQFYRLSFWKVASEELNYRRFFTINDLISMKVEDKNAFAYMHALTLQWVGENKITGLRVDHIDGLYHPLEYLGALRQKAGEHYIIVEKILQAGETLPEIWPVEGTTGYDFMNAVNQLFCDRRSEKKFSRMYESIIGPSAPYKALLVDKKRLIIGKYMAGDIDGLAQLLKSISSKDRHGADITLYGLRRALVEVLAFFPVYRTYIDRANYSSADRAVMLKVVTLAKETNPHYINELEFIEKFLLSDDTGYLTEEQRQQRAHFVMRLQQFTGPLMAKGFEDTVLYVYNRFIALNEVGGAPERFGVSRGEFHGFLAERARRWPHTLNATSSHDSKRGEDARARLNVLSEMPGEWEKHARAWMKMNARAKVTVREQPVPAANDEYFFYQSFLGHFPFDDRAYLEFVKRLKEYTVKAVREAKVYTAWLKPDNDYEAAFLSFIDRISRPALDNPFLLDFLPFQKKVTHYGILNSLAQVLIKMTAPGVPDFYQGTELWDLSFVDPDNRSPVDFALRQEYLDDIVSFKGKNAAPLLQALFKEKENGKIKLYFIHAALALRKKFPEVFASGEYMPLTAYGAYEEHVCAFARIHNGRWAVTVTPRFLTGIMHPEEYPARETLWHDTSLALPAEAPALFWDVISRRAIRRQGALPLAELFKDFPAALLISKV